MFLSYLMCSSHVFLSDVFLSDVFLSDVFLSDVFLSDVFLSDVFLCLAPCTGYPVPITLGLCRWLCFTITSLISAFTILLQLISSTPV